jgi:hypothetical protein
MGEISAARCRETLSRIPSLMFLPPARSVMLSLLVTGGLDQEQRPLDLAIPLLLPLLGEALRDRRVDRLLDQRGWEHVPLAARPAVGLDEPLRAAIAHLPDEVKNPPFWPYLGLWQALEQAARCFIDGCGRSALRRMSVIVSEFSRVGNRLWD